MNNNCYLVQSSVPHSSASKENDAGMPVDRSWVQLALHEGEVAYYQGRLILDLDLPQSFEEEHQTCGRGMTVPVQGL